MKVNNYCQMLTSFSLNSARKSVWNLGAIGTVKIFGST
jgi:hypothetical protein